MTRIFLVATLLSIFLSLNGQQGSPGGNGFAGELACELDANLLTPSPSAASFGRFGDIPVGLYHGTVQYSIPVYTLKSAHLELPVTLNYAGNGLRVDEISSNIGHGWSLFTGGVINRSINESADEHASSTPKQSWFESFINNPLTLNNGSLNEEMVTYIRNPNNTRDGLSDIFFFDLGGESGAFIVERATNVIPHTTTPRIIKGSNQLKIEYHHDTHFFTITDRAGIKYYFNHVEIQWENNRNRLFETLDINNDLETVPIQHKEGHPERITSWFISKIVHPLGDSIVFEYSTTRDTYLRGYYEKYRHFLDTEWGFPGWEWELGKVPFETHEEMIKSAYHFGYRIDMSDNRLITKIKASNGINIHFKYTGGRKDYKKNGFLLKEIVVEHNSDTLKWLRFTHQEVTSKINDNHPHFNSEFESLKYRYFLTKLSEKLVDGSDSISHNFEYNGLDSLPNRFSRSQDFGGFYNGTQANRLVTCIVQFMGYGNPPIVTPDNSNRQPHWKYAQKGMLNKIIYPTGGFTSIMYEANKSGSQEYSGIRVSKTIDHAGNEALPVIKRYYYNSYENRNISLGHYPYSETLVWGIKNFYIFNCVIINGFIYCPDIEEAIYYYTMYSSSPRSFFRYNDNGLLFYPKVTVSHGGDQFETGGASYTFKYSVPQSASAFGDQATPLGIYENNAMYNGEMETELQFKISNSIMTPVRKIQHHFAETTTFTKYNLAVEKIHPDVAGNFMLPPSDWVVGTRYGLEYFKIYGKALSLLKTTTTIYDQNGENPVEQNMSFCYNEYFQQVSATYAGSDEQIRKDSIRYATHYFGTSSSVFNSMKNNNLLDYPVERVQYVNNKIVAAQLNIYGSNVQSNDPVPVNIVRQYRLLVTAPLAGHSFYDGATVPSGYEKEWEYQYNNGNKMVEAVYKDTKKTSYIWGYNNSRLTGIAENCAFGNTGIGYHIYPDAIPDNQETTLRSLPDAMVTTFTYMPGVGMLTRKEPNGLKTKYEYDAFGRLKCVRDDDGNILQYYGYNYGITN